MFLHHHIHEMAPEISPVGTVINNDTGVQCDECLFWFHAEYLDLLDEDCANLQSSDWTGVVIIVLHPSTLLPSADKLLLSKCPLWPLALMQVLVMCH